MSTILVGSAPDSWGVWFPDDPKQTPYTRFLDEVAASGYQWIELGTAVRSTTSRSRMLFRVDGPAENESSRRSAKSAESPMPAAD